MSKLMDIIFEIFFEREMDQYLKDKIKDSARVQAIMIYILN